MKSSERIRKSVRCWSGLCKLHTLTFVLVISDDKRLLQDDDRNWYGTSLYFMSSNLLIFLEGVFSSNMFGHPLFYKCNS